MVNKRANRRNKRANCAKRRVLPLRQLDMKPIKDDDDYVSPLTRDVWRVVPASQLTYTERSAQRPALACRYWILLELFILIWMAPRWFLYSRDLCAIYYPKLRAIAARMFTLLAYSYHWHLALFVSAIGPLIPWETIGTGFCPSVGSGCELRSFLCSRPVDLLGPIELLGTALLPPVVGWWVRFGSFGHLPMRSIARFLVFALNLLAYFVIDLIYYSWEFIVALLLWDIVDYYR